MSGGGDVRVLRQESGQESPRMPAWKREILERRKAKGSGSGAGGESSSSATTSRVNGEVTGNSGSKNKDDASGANPNGNYTITPANQFFSSKRGSGTPKSPELSPVKTKELWTAIESYDPKSAESKVRDNGTEESLVLQESLGPLEENPFIKLEKERKKQLDRDSSGPMQHILELYGSVPGIRTIRAENIIIIESDPDYFPEGSGIKHASKLQQNGVSSYSSLNDLLERRGSPVTEIRAKEVVIYDSALSKSEENLSTVGHGSELADLADSQGRVSRMLQKFDRNYGKLQPRSRSTENLLELDSTSVRPRSRPPPKPDLVPKSVTSSVPGSPVHTLDRSVPFSPQISQSSKTKAQPPLSDVESPPASPQPVSALLRSLESSRGGRRITINPREEADRVGSSKPIREREWDQTDGSSKPPKVPCSPVRARADVSDDGPGSPQPPGSPTSPTFEFRPAPRPDLSLVPTGDLQARALANLRLQSRKSFTVIPKARRSSSVSSASSPGSTTPSSPVLSPPPSSQRPSEPTTFPAPLNSTLAAAAAAVPTSRVVPPPTPPVSKKRESERGPRPAKKELLLGQSVPSSPTPALPTSPAPPSQPKTEPVAQPSPPLPAEKLPVTNIDDVDVEPTPPGQPSASPVVQKRKGNTFTVVPKRKQEPQAASPDPQDSAAGSPVAGAGASQAPYAQLGTLLKKRYPAVDEIEVIGGYLSLGRSCLSTSGSTGRKLKISFNESSLQSTFEYPSENSMWGSGDEEDEEEEEEEEEVDGGRPRKEEERSLLERVRIPRASFTSSPTHTTTTTNNSTDLSNYTPKHGMDYSAYQDKHDGSHSQRTETPQEEVMLTPADSSSLSDFSSEPALYF
ncbi:taperin [Sardina pilchardus]|uniref:taperin n=1 Tax=Sardina pilchardus TaxID=27697 RepID=UPI002E146349